MLIQLSLTDCLLCGMTAGTSFNLCHECTNALPHANRPCKYCGTELKSESESKTCGPCLTKRPVFNHCIPGFSYLNPISKLIAQFKFDGNFAAGSALSELLTLAFMKYCAQHPPPDLIIPVPLHPIRLGERGFNQSLEIAKVIHRMSGIPLSKNTLSRTRNTKPQTELNGAKFRRVNLKDAFSCAQTRGMAARPHIALIDDVITTGATVSEAARALFIGGARQVDCFCVARANQ